jgi:DNA-binding MarR family transcriptional regulator
MATTSRAPQLASRLRLAVARTARRLRQEAGGGLSPTLTPSELAARERIKRPTATRLIASLEQDGLVARTSDPSDGRSSLIATTPEGRDLMRTLRTRKDAYLARRLAKLTAGERETLARAADLLERLLEEDEA